MYTIFNAIFIINLTDKIHYQIYDSLGNVVQVLVDNDGKASTGVSRTDNDGTLVAGIDQVLAYTYNVKGEQTSLLRDNNVDGKYDYREAYTLDANGRQVQKEIDLTNDGQFDKKESYVLNATGGVLQTTAANIFTGTDGQKVDVVTRISYNKLNANNQIEESRVDTLGDGSINAVTTHKLDEYGRISEAFFDADGNGSIDRREVYDYYANGSVKTKGVDIGNTGTIDSSETYIRDALGRVTTILQDNDNNGQIDSSIYHRYDIYGNSISVRRDTDNNLETPDYLETTTYNSSAQRERVYIDRTGNGVTSDDILYYFTYTSNGNMRTVTEYDPSRAGSYIDSVLEIDQPNRQALRYIRTNHYDEYRRDTIWEVDRDGNGKIDTARDETRYFSYEYDENNPNAQAYSKATSLKVINGLNQVKSNEYYEYDAYGSRQLTMLDSDGNGTLNTLSIGAGGTADKFYHLDMTDSTVWTAEKLAKLSAVNIIQLSNPSTESSLTLNQDVLKALSKHITIFGDATDTVNLGDIELKNLNSQKTIGTEIYDRYTTEIDGSSYELVIDTDIKFG